MNEFGKRLKKLRTERNLFLVDVANAVGTNKSSLSRYENGLMDPNLDALVKIGKYFNVSLDWLCGNGNIDEVDYVEDGHYNRLSRYVAYTDALNSCLENNVSPVQLEQLVDVLTTVRK